MNPEQSFVAWNAFVVPDERFCEEAADAEQARAASEKTAAARTRMLAGNPDRPTIVPSLAREPSVPGTCGRSSSVAAELDSVPMSGFHIFSPPWAASLSISEEMIVVGGRNRQRASIPKSRPGARRLTNPPLGFMRAGRGESAARQRTRLSSNFHSASTEQNVALPASSVRAGSPPCAQRSTWRRPSSPAPVATLDLLLPE